MLPNRPDSTRTLFGALAFLAVATLQLLSLGSSHGWQPGRMVRIADPARHDAGFDGQYYFHLAEDPRVGEATARKLDAPVLRATRIGYPLAARWVAPLVGGVLPALLVVQLLALGVVIVVLQRAAEPGRAAALVVAVALGLPFVLSVELVTAELPCAAALLAAAAATRRERPVVAALALAVAVLVKEVAALAAVAFAVAELARRRPRRALLDLAAILPLAAWHSVLRLRLADASGGSPLDNLTLPGVGPLGALATNAAAQLGGHGSLATLGRLGALAWYLAGVGLAVALAGRHRPTAGRLVLAAGAALALLLARGAPSHAYDGVFNFGRQLFLLPVGAILVRYFESSTLTPRARRALSAWLVAGGALGLAWWAQQIAAS